jgi:hypothetical protein
MCASCDALDIRRPHVFASIRGQPRYSITQEVTQYSAMPLTDTRVQTLTIGSRNERLVVDTNGLYLRLRKGMGPIRRTWQFRRRDGGKLSIATLGIYPGMSLKEAASELQNWLPDAIWHALR